MRGECNKKKGFNQLESPGQDEQDSKRIPLLENTPAVYASNCEYRSGVSKLKLTLITCILYAQDGR
jgi:hypothetical protein